jgi:WD40 repeat protein
VRFLAIFLLMFIAGTSAAPAFTAVAAEIWLGALTQDITAEQAAKLRWKGPRGAEVTSVERRSPAEKAGLIPGDIILTVDGEEVDTAAKLGTILKSKVPYQDVKLRLWRRDTEIGVSVRLVMHALYPIALAEKTGPEIQLDTGGHTAQIVAIAVTPDKKHLISASVDGNIRVWDIEKEKTERIIRGYSSPEGAGRIWAMALSPDGQLLAVGGWMDRMSVASPCCGDIRLFDVSTGKLVGLLKGHDDIVLSLAFSPDGKKLISSQRGKKAFAIVWNLKDRKPQTYLRPYEVKECEDGGMARCAINQVRFTQEGTNAITASEDKLLRLWDISTGKMIAEMSGHENGVTGLAVSSTEGTIASSDRDGGIRLWNSRSGKFLRALAKDRQQACGLNFIPESNGLMSCEGLETQVDAPNGVNIWNVMDGSAKQTYHGHTVPVTAAAVEPGGRWVATGDVYGEIHIWDVQKAETMKRLNGIGNAVWAVAFSEDGQTIAWGNSRTSWTPNAYGPLQYQLSLPLHETVSETAAFNVVNQFPPIRLLEPEKKWVPVVQQRGDKTITFKRGDAFGDILELTQNGQVMAKLPVYAVGSSNQGHRAFGFIPNGQGIFSASEKCLNIYELATLPRDNRILPPRDHRCRSIHDGTIWAAAVSPDGRLMITGSADQTVKIWNRQTGELIVTLFRGNNEQWVMWTPQGYHVGNSNLLGWKLNRTLDREADFVGADRMGNILWRPDIVLRALQYASATRAVWEAEGSGLPLIDILEEKNRNWPWADKPQQ